MPPLKILLSKSLLTAFYDHLLAGSLSHAGSAVKRRTNFPGSSHNSIMSENFCDPVRADQQDEVDDVFEQAYCRGESVIHRGA